MAVKNLIARPESYGLTLADVPNRPFFTILTTSRHIDVKLAAQLAEMPVEDFLALNPSHNRPVIRAESSQSILLPADRADRFQANLSAHDQPLTSWQSYTIGRQDRLEGIAERFGIPVAQLRDVNGLSSRVRTLAGLTILVPTKRENTEVDLASAGFATPAAPEPRPSTSTAPQKYVVKPGESLAVIAQRFGLSVAQLASRNGIRNGRITAGQTLLIDGASAQAVAATPAASEQRTASAAKPAQVHKTKAASTKRAPVARTAVVYSPRPQ
jgi:membrane-bound lytic murein transglycosylase D